MSNTEPAYAEVAEVTQSSQKTAIKNGLFCVLCESFASSAFGSPLSRRFA